MGSYVTSTISNEDYHKLIQAVRDGYIDSHGIQRKPNPQIATILVLEGNLGCRINDIISMTTDSIIKDGEIWKLNVIEQKTKKERYFIVPKPIKDFIDNYIELMGIEAGRLFTVSAAAVWKCLRQVTDYLGLENVSSHSLRKMCANALYDATDHDIEAVCSFLNHSSVTITRRYIKRSDKQMEEAIGKIVNLA